MNAPYFQGLSGYWKTITSLGIALLCSKGSPSEIFIWEDMSLLRTSKLILGKKIIVLNKLDNVINNLPHARLRNLFRIL
jgi:hypothetical protein